MRRALALALLIAVSAVPAASAQTDYTLRAKGSATDRGDVLSIGGFQPRVDPSVSAALAVFGSPSSRRVTSAESCRMGWRALGLRIVFVNLGAPGAGPCSAGKVQTASAFGRVWRTDRGLQIGQSVRTLRRLYPRAYRKGRTYRLVGGRNVYGVRGGRYSVLAAKTNGRTVRAFKLDVGAAGE